MNQDAEEFMRTRMNSSVQADEFELNERQQCMRDAIAWAYADAAKLCRVAPDTDAADIQCGDCGVALCNDLAAAIEDRAK